MSLEFCLSVVIQLLKAYNNKDTDKKKGSHHCCESITPILTTRLLSSLFTYCMLKNKDVWSKEEKLNTDVVMDTFKRASLLK